MITVPFICLPARDDIAVVPVYAKPGDAGCDGKANLEETVYLAPGRRILVPLGIAAAIPEGYEIQVRPRSGLALKHGVTVLNTPGTIDSSFRGELAAIITNHGTDIFEIKPGDRICQLVLNKVETIDWERVHHLPASERGMGGFGHTGVANE